EGQNEDDRRFRNAPRADMRLTLIRSPHWPARVATAALGRSAVTALTLITNSNLAGSWIGRSAGFDPLRIFSPYRRQCGDCDLVTSGNLRQSAQAIRMLLRAER